LSFSRQNMRLLQDTTCVFFKTHVNNKTNNNRQSWTFQLCLLLWHGPGPLAFPFMEWLARVASKPLGPDGLPVVGGGGHGQHSANKEKNKTNKQKHQTKQTTNKQTNK
jgi:hypothetical protein